MFCMVCDQLNFVLKEPYDILLKLDVLKISETASSYLCSYHKVRLFVFSSLLKRAYGIVLCVHPSIHPSVGQSVDKCQTSVLETLLRAVNAVRDFFYLFIYFFKYMFILQQFFPD